MAGQGGTPATGARSAPKSAKIDGPKSALLDGGSWVAEMAGRAGPGRAGTIRMFLTLSTTRASRHK